MSWIEEHLSALVESRLREEVRGGVQTIQYQVLTLLTTNGQAPFVTVFMYLGEARNEQERKDLALIIEETLAQRYEGVKTRTACGSPPPSPSSSTCWRRTTSGRRPLLVSHKAGGQVHRQADGPDYISEKKMLELKWTRTARATATPAWAAAAFLTPYVDPETGKPKYYGGQPGRGHHQPPRRGLSSGGNVEKFWKIFDERLELCHRASCAAMSV